jgi:LAS superfamily LD-carboxypeptidase LdcB/peptidoglycan hydrolase-like protein with peptidoglycan-binding domain
MKANIFEHLQRIKGLMGIVVENTIKSMPIEIQKAIEKLESNYGIDILDSHIKKEINQEGNWQKDAGSVNQQALKQIQKLISDAKEEFGSKIQSKGIVSGYRSYDDQVKNFGNKAKSRGIDDTQRYNTIPGFSQHHTGKAFDIFSVEDSWWDQNSDVKKWVADNAKNYGFEITYKTDGILRGAEPWHLFYVGGESDITKKKVSDSEVDSYFAGPKVDEKLEKNIEKQYEKKRCKANSNYTEAPGLEEIKSGVVVRIGHMGEVVEEIQKKLESLNYDLGFCGVDGLFGKKTKKAVEKFQEDNGLTVSSSIDESTIKKLFTTTKSAKVSKSAPKSAVEKGTATSPDSYTQSKDSEYLIYTPKNYTGKEVHVLFAGANSYRGGNASLSPSFYGAGVDPIKNKVIVVITHWNNSVPRVQDYVSKKFGGKITSIAGFSKGGRPLWDYVGPRSNMKFVGLIDPSPEGEGSGMNPYIDLDFGNNTVMVANWKNWGDKPPGFVPSKVLKWYCDHRNDSKYKGKVICTDSSGYDHSQIFNTFYSKFASRI